MNTKSRLIKIDNEVTALTVSIGKARLMAEENDREFFDIQESPQGKDPYFERYLKQQAAIRNSILMGTLKNMDETIKSLGNIMAESFKGLEDEETTDN